MTNFSFNIRETASGYNPAEHSNSKDFEPISEGWHPMIVQKVKFIDIQDKPELQGLDIEFVVTGGPFTKRKHWQKFYFSGKAEKSTKRDKAFVGIIADAYALEGEFTPDRITELVGAEVDVNVSQLPPTASGKIKTWGQDFRGNQTPGKPKPSPATNTTTPTAQTKQHADPVVVEEEDDFAFF